MLVNPHFLYSISSSTKLGFILKKSNKKFTSMSYVTTNLKGVDFILPEYYKPIKVLG